MRGWTLSFGRSSEKTKSDPALQPEGPRGINVARLKGIIRTAEAPGPPPEALFYKPACVFLLLYDLEEPHILAVQKADSEGYPWRNQVALPGGHLEEDDPNPLEAAFRELEEEVDIGRDRVELIGSLGHFQTINNRDIEVFAGFWNGRGSVRHDPAEISRIIEIPLRSLVQTHIARNYQGRIPGVEELRYPVDGAVIWGVTARILHHFIEMMYPLLGNMSSE